MFDFAAGRLPLVVSIPHAGTVIPAALAARMTPAALAVADTDWHLPTLYAFVRDMGGSVLAAGLSRYVIDLNRPPEDANLYPGQDTTGLCPIDTFLKEPLYREGEGLDAAEMAERVERYWRPYHAQLRAELDRLVAVHGYALLWEAHSIASVVPRFFAGKLPDLNLGTDEGRSCSPSVQAAVERTLAAQDAYTWVANGRFKGGYITRHYGDPVRRIHAVQMEICQCTYMDERAPFPYRAAAASRLQPLLARLIEQALIGAMPID
jgi:N-formylglutamate deformylase